MKIYDVEYKLRVRAEGEEIEEAMRNARALIDCAKGGWHDMTEVRVRVIGEIQPKENRFKRAMKLCHRCSAGMAVAKDLKLGWVHLVAGSELVPCLAAEVQDEITAIEDEAQKRSGRQGL